MVDARAVTDVPLPLVGGQQGQARVEAGEVNSALQHFAIRLEIHAHLVVDGLALRTEDLAVFSEQVATLHTFAASLRTQAVVDGGDYVINGSKMFISGAGDTDYLVTMLRTGGPGPKGISCVVIPSGTEGIQFGHNLHKMGWNSQPTREIVFDNVRVPIGHRLGEEGDGFKIAMKGLDGGRINIGTCSVGTAQAALNRAKSYMSERQQFGEPLSNFQALQFKLADMATELVAARQMIRMAASRVDAGHSEATVYAAMAKQFATDVGFKVCNEALQIHGGYGYMQEYPLERHIRDTRVHQILEGTNEIMRVITARRLLALADIEAIQ